MKYRSLLIILSSLLLCASIAMAQPSEQQIRKDIGAADAIRVRFTKASGTRQWNKDLGNWEYVRGVEVVRRSNIPGVNLLVVGDAVYQQQSASTYTYWKFRVLENKYEGLKEPSSEEVMKLISTNWAQFYGYLYGETLKIIEAPHVATDAKWSWDSPTIVDLDVVATLEMVWRGPNVAQVEQHFRVRLFRDDKDSPWARFIVTSRDDQKVLSQKEYSFDRINEMKKRSIEFTMEEQLAKAAAEKLPQVEVKEFSSAMELAQFVHDVMRNGNAERFRAVMMKLLSNRFFESGSTTRLNAFGEQSMREWTQKVFDGRISYRDEYCQQFDNHSLNTDKVIYIQSCIQRVLSTISVDRFNVGYVEGVAKTALRITQIDITVRTDDDAKAFLDSFSDRKKLCPKD